MGLSWTLNDRHTRQRQQGLCLFGRKGDHRVNKKSLGELFVVELDLGRVVEQVGVVVVVVVHIVAEHRPHSEIFQ